MPLFEYRCERCRAEFELLVRNGEPVHCPHCGSGDPRKLLSAPSVLPAKRPSLPIAAHCPPSDAPPCGPGCCRLG